MELSKNRLGSIDIARGLIMIIMALDHVRDFFHSEGKHLDSLGVPPPTDMETTYPLLFFTRWITHFCAPSFVFLAGASIYFMTTRKKEVEIKKFLFTRGLWLLCVDLLLVSFGWTLRIQFDNIFFSVVSVIGIGMMVMSFLINVNVKNLLVGSVLIIIGHNIVDHLQWAQELRGKWWADLFYFAGFSSIEIFPGHRLIFLYAIIPWVSVLVAGYCFGNFFLKFSDSHKRQKALMNMGIIITLAFIMLRLWNVYGDPVTWDIQERGLSITLLSFLNLTKYPPSLLYLSMTLGPMIFLLGILEKYSNRFTDNLKVFGRVPLFYYILHIFLIRILNVINFYIQGYSSKDIYDPEKFFAFRPYGSGFSLPVVYLIWILVVIVLYPICVKYDRYKTMHKKWWLSYL